MLPLPFQLYIALIASFNLPRVFLPKGQICPSCDSRDEHQSVLDTIIMLLQFKQNFPIQFLSSHKAPFLSAAVQRSTKHKYLCSLLWFTALQTTVTSPCVPMAVCLLLGGYFLALILHQIVSLFPWEAFVHVSAPQTLQSQYQFSSSLLAPPVPLH